MNKDESEFPFKFTIVNLSWWIEPRATYPQHCSCRSSCSGSDLQNLPCRRSPRFFRSSSRYGTCGCTRLPSNRRMPQLPSATLRPICWLLSRFVCYSKLGPWSHGPKPAEHLRRTASVRSQDRPAEPRRWISAVVQVPAIRHHWSLSLYRNRNEWTLFWSSRTVSCYRFEPDRCLLYQKGGYSVKTSFIEYDHRSMKMIRTKPTAITNHQSIPNWLVIKTKENGCFLFRFLSKMSKDLELRPSLPVGCSDNPILIEYRTATMKHCRLFRLRHFCSLTVCNRFGLFV